MLSLKDIEFATKELVKIGHSEREVKIGDFSIVLRTLTPIEESEIQRISTGLDNKEDEVTTLEFVDLFRLTSLAYSIVEINGVNLRGQEFVETDELLPNGVKVKKKKTEVMTDILYKLSRTMLGVLFEGYVALNKQAEEEARKIIPEAEIVSAVEEKASQAVVPIEAVQEQAKKIDKNTTVIGSIIKEGMSK